LITIENYDRKYLEDMTELYNSETAFEPYIARLDPDIFIELIEKKSYFDPEGIFIAIQNVEIVGWIHACVAPGSEGHHDPDKRIPRIRMLIFPRENLKAGIALVAEATAWLRQFAQSEIEAIHARSGYPFYRGLWLGGEPMCPMTMPHLQIAFETVGYKNDQESVFMTSYMPSQPKDYEASMRLEFIEAKADMRHEPMRESWIGFDPMRISAILGGEEVGSISYVIIPYVIDRLGAPCMNIWGMGVKEKYRRRGIATAIVARAMSRSYSTGARFASVSTQLWNAPAHATYLKLGLRPHCILAGRLLK